jgi:gliding motility-associated protein GldM
MNLMNVDAKDNYDVPMLVLGINEDLKAPKGKGAELWKQLLSYRAEVIKLFVESSPKPDNAPAYNFKDPNIIAFKDMKDLKKQVNAAIEKSIVPKDEKEEIADLYMGLTKNQIVTNADKEKIHWIGKTFDHSPIVAALASLTSLQNEILTTRANIISRIRSRVGGGEYSFNKVVSLAYGPDLVNANDSALVQVMMAAFDSDRQPEVTLDGQKVSEVKDGQGFVRLKAGATDMNLKGTITIKKKDGSPKTMDWEKTIKVMKPSATIMLPELMVLYKGYQNKVKGLASGYDQTVLSASGGISLVKSGDVYIANVPNSAGKTATISVSGKSSVTNKTANLGTFTFDIKPMPSPSLFVDGAESGAKISKRVSAINAAYGPGIPLKAAFTVLKWSVGVQGIMREAEGVGNSLASAAAVLNQGKPGSKVYVSATVKFPTGLSKVITAEYSL